MTYPWQGAARPMSPDAFASAARTIGCEAAVIEAIWMTESAGRGFRSDGTVERRFEPHKMPGSSLTWRDSLKYSRSAREAAFMAAYSKNPNAALRASSWGGPQIMGFNAEDAGFLSAEAMVRAMARDEGAHLTAFCCLIRTWGLAPAIRARDWQTIERRYNGGGFGGAYARKMEKHYRRIKGGGGGASSPTVLRIGSSGASVRRLQRALGLTVDGSFGPQTDAAVRAFQAEAALSVDGVVGARTWAEIERKTSVTSLPQPSNWLAQFITNILERFIA
ncbi:MAG TPA: hypothetical protein DIT40_08240 [Alphaproteobacteria bacterium]|nr:hypothetical protein [Alphaproteobacteria bacterium]